MLSVRRPVLGASPTPDTPSCSEISLGIFCLLKWTRTHFLSLRACSRTLVPLCSKLRCSWERAESQASWVQVLVLCLRNLLTLDKLVVLQPLCA